MEINDLCGIIEAILYVAGEPVRVDQLAHALNLTQMELEPAIEKLRDNCLLEKRGVRVNRHGAEIQMSINPDYAKYVEMLLQPVQKQSLSQAVMAAGIAEGIHGQRPWMTKPVRGAALTKYGR